MATEKITGFDIKSFEAIDPRTVVADQTGRTSIAYPYVGMKVYQIDTAQTYRYKGTPPTNTVSDWDRVPEFLSGSGVPAGTLGAIDDYYIDTATNYFYQKTGTSTWTLRTDFTGAQLFAGAGAPDNGVGVDGDMYFQDTGQVYKKSGGVWGSSLFSIAGAPGSDGDLYSTTSVTSVNIPTVHPTAVSLTVATGLSYSIGQSVVAAEDSTNYFEGIITGYNSGTGVLDISSTANTGTGSAPTTAWTVNLNAVAGQEGATGKPGVPDTVYTGGGGTYPNSTSFDETEITAVEADVQWTADNPYISYILTDSRSNVNAPATLTGTKAGNIVIWNGTSWVDKGRIRGFDGAAGSNGWSPVIGTEVVSSTFTALKLLGWKGGTGSAPSLGTAVYISNSGLVADVNLATNVKGPQGDKGDIGDVASAVTEFNPGSYRFNIGDTITTASPPIVNTFASTGTTPVSSFNTRRSNGIIANINDEMWIRGEIGSKLEVPAITSDQNITSIVNVSLVMSLDGTFVAGSTHSRYVIVTNTFAFYNNMFQILYADTAWKFPAAGTWYARMEISLDSNKSRPILLSGNNGLRFRVLRLNSA